jgi:sugar lactone lactonase YvrE
MSEIALNEPLVPVEKIELAWLGIDHAEGLAIDGDGNVWAGGEEGQVYRGSLEEEPREVARLPGRTLGFALDGRGNAYCATIAEPGIFRITVEGEVSLVSAGAPDRAAAEPNYPAFLPSAILLYTDSGTWGEDDGCIFAVTPDGRSRVVDTSASRFPNGLAVLDGGRRLAVVESNLPGVSVLSVGENGSLAERRVLVEMPGTVPDGLAVDVSGRLLISCWAPDAVFVLEPDGELRLLAHDPLRYVLHEPTNIAFIPDTNRLVAANYGERFLSVLEHDTEGAPPPMPFFDWSP